MPHTGPPLSQSKCCELASGEHTLRADLPARFISLLLSKSAAGEIPAAGLFKRRSSVQISQSREDFTAQGTYCLFRVRPEWRTKAQMSRTERDQTLQPLDHFVGATGNTDSQHAFIHQRACFFG